MKRIFILTGEPSGDRLATTVISKLKKENSNIEYLSVGGSYLKSLGIKSIFDLKDITYLGFTDVLFNIFKIKKKIDYTVDEIMKFNPDILFSVDSPDFTLRVAERVKKINPDIKVIHFVAPQVWVWREARIKKFKSFLDHVLLLFPFEKKYFGLMYDHDNFEEKLNEALEEIDKYNEKMTNYTLNSNKMCTEFLTVFNNLLLDKE